MLTELIDAIALLAVSLGQLVHTAERFQLDAFGHRHLVVISALHCVASRLVVRLVALIGRSSG